MPHYVYVIDDQGRRAKLVATTLMRLTCTNDSCGAGRMWIDWKPGYDENTLGMITVCFHCGSALKREWGAGQLAFISSADFGVSEPETGDLLKIEHADTDDLPFNWADAVTGDLAPEDPKT